MVTAFFDSQGLIYPHIIPRGTAIYTIKVYAQQAVGVPLG
jgi:hypothetical protein